MMNRTFLSDVTDMNPIHFKRRHPESKVTEVSDTELLHPLYHNSNGALCFLDSGLLFLDDYAQHVRQTLYKKYLQQRDIYRQQVYNNQYRINPNPTYWSNSSTRMAGDIFAHIPKGSTRAFVTRMSWDWHLTGLNSCKGSNSLEMATCSLCGAPVEDQAHIIWGCENIHMKAARDFHLKEIDKQRILSSKVKRNPLEDNIHNLIRNPLNYELILGRIHTHHHRGLMNLDTKSETNTNTNISRFFRI